MKKEQLVVIVLILAVGLSVFFLGRSGTRGVETGQSRIMAALQARQIPIMAVVGRREAGAYLGELRHGLRTLPQTDRVKIIVVDPANPNERETLAAMKLGKPPTLLVLGLDGRGVYGKAGRYDMMMVTKAITEGLQRQPIDLHSEEDEHGHGHSD